MVKERLTLEPEVQEILHFIDNKRNFLLSGGAGSGKTYSLIQVIRQVIAENPTSKVACMTYTNAAVKEIEERVSHRNLNVSTIHDFLWDNIKHFKKALKSALIELINDVESKINIDETTPILNDYFDHLEKGIQYKEYLKIKEGIISHDELLIVSNFIFEKYPSLSSIVKDKYQFIFIDEYQDTSKTVVDIFLNHFKKSKKLNIVGFFGDAMQSIYDDTIGNLDEYIGDTIDMVHEVKKTQNRRSPHKVIELANRLRTDGILQEPSIDGSAPNMVDGRVKEGNILFIYSHKSEVLSVKQYLCEKYGWKFENAMETKELNLTHNLIADKAGFRILMDIYDKDMILSYRDRIKKYIKDKGITTDFSEKTFGEVIAVLEQGKTGKELNVVRPTSAMQIFIDCNSELYQETLNYKYGVFCKMYVNKDQLLDDKKQDEEDENKMGSKRDKLIKHLFKIQNNIMLDLNGRYNEFLRATDYRDKIVRIEDKRTLKSNIESLVNVGDKTIDEVINDAHEKGICLKDDKLEDFKTKNGYLYNRVKEVKYSEFQNLYDYLEGKTPFSTQHKTKGTEFNNVLVILDNGGWNNYNFENLFLNKGTPSVLARTQKIFYVCCTRAKDNLVVFYHNPSPAVINKASEWFGKDNIVEL
ncbi:MAG: UvrD-helicase domain-containing protein [Haliscomenobacter sp.]|nr:UvrD-helicase domain-containing protein [Haliscomenobacter sp.]